LRKFINELFSAYYDPNTDTIHGCRKYSYAWFHEYRHMLQMKQKLLHNIWLWLPSITGILGLVMVWFLIIIPSQVVLMLGGYFILPISFFLLFLELDAHLYAMYYKIIRAYNRNFRWDR
jgi:hypothetical protein